MIVHDALKHFISHLFDLSSSLIFMYFKKVNLFLFMQAKGGFSENSHRLYLYGTRMKHKFSN